MHTIKNIIRNSKLIKESSIFLFFNILNKIIPFLLLPILTTYLTPNDYGVISTFQVFLSITFVFVGLNLHGIVGVKHYKLDDKVLARYTGNTIILVFFSFILCGLLISIFHGILETILKIDKYLLYIALILAVLKYSYDIVLTKFQMNGNALLFGSFSTVKVILDISITLILILIYSFDFKGRIYGIAFSISIISIISLVYLYKQKLIVFKYNTKYTFEQLKFGTPLIFASLSGIILTGSDRIIINNFIDLTTTGIYTVGLQFGMIIGFISYSFNMAWTPYLFKKLDKLTHKDKLIIARITYLSIVSFILIAIVLTIISPIIIDLFVGDEFHKAEQFIFYLAIGYAFDGCRYLFINYFYYYNKTYISAILFFITAVINIILSIIFIKKYGVIGVAMASTISFALNFIFTWLASLHLINIPWFDKNIFNMAIK